MKRLLSLLLAVSLVMTGFVFVPAVYADTDPYAIAVPASWELVGEETFAKEPVDNGDGTVTSNFGMSTWTGNFLEFVETTAYEDEATGVTQDSYTYITSDGLQLVMPKAKRSNSITLKMKKAIDLSTENDYYIMYDVRPRKTNSSNVTFHLYNNDNYVVDTNGAYTVESVLSSNNSPFSLTQCINRTYLKTADATAASTATQYTWADRDHDYSTFSSRWFRVLVQISPRANGYTLYRERWFDISGAEGEEAPSITPSYWNNTSYYDLTKYVGDKLDTLKISSSHNAGGSETIKFDNFKVYKAPALNSYMVPTKSGKNTNIAVKYQSTEAVVSTANYNYTMTMDTVPEGVELVSQGWYDYSDSVNPVLLADGASIDVPADMRGKLLKAKLVVKENGTENTYYPFVGYVRDVVDLYAGVNSNVANTSPYTAKLTYYKTNSDGTLATKTTQTSSNSNTAALTYVDWTNATRLDITGQFYVNSMVNANDGIINIVLAHYAKDGTLKKVIKPNPELTTYQNGPTLISNFSSRTVQTFNAKLIDGSNYDFSTIEAGDYFKTFLWKTTVSPAAVNKKYYYKFEQMIPLNYNPNRTADSYDITLPVVTVPMPAE